MAATALFLSTTVVRLQMLCSGHEIGVGTGFFLPYGGSHFLVSAWHVLSGCNPNTGQPRNSTTGAVPDTVRFHTARRVEERVEWTQHTLKVGNSLSGTSTWYQHPTLGQEIDVGVLPLPRNLDLGSAKNLLDPEGHDGDMFIDTGAEVFLPGFPLGLSDEGFPIWKRASVATSLEWGAGMNKKFLVDTASREGMSGSPCLALQNWRYYRIDRVTGRMRIIERPLSFRLLGVYSGRINAHDALGAQLGVVWREGLIFQTIEGRQQGVAELRR